MTDLIRDAGCRTNRQRGENETLSADHPLSTDSDWDDLDSNERPDWLYRQAHYSDQQVPRSEVYRGPATKLSDEECMAMAGELLSAFPVVKYGMVPLPPTGLPGTTSYRILGDETAELLALGAEYAEAAYRREPRRMHNIWSKAFEMLLKHRNELLKTKNDLEYYRNEVVNHYASQQPAQDDRPRSVYFIGSDPGPIKIGIAVDVTARLKGLQTSHPHKLTLLATCDGGQPKEREYHRRFAAHRLNGEWFERCPEILAEIERLSG